jgi:hypothetical protein
MFEHSGHVVSADIVSQKSILSATDEEKDRSIPPPVFFYDGATPTEKSIAAWAAGGEQSANAASCEGAARSAGVLLAANFRNWGRIPAQRWDRKDTLATSVRARNILD